MSHQSKTFTELKRELKICNDPVREKIIRNIMFSKYLDYQRRQREQIVNTIVREGNPDDNGHARDETIKRQPDSGKNNDGYDSDEKIGRRPGSDEKKEKQRYTEYNRDIANNNLNNRLNGDIAINAYHKEKKDHLINPIDRMCSSTVGSKRKSK